MARMIRSPLVFQAPIASHQNGRKPIVLKGVSRVQQTLRNYQKLTEAHKKAAFARQFILAH
jgi:hypothetical protein